MGRDEAVKVDEMEFLLISEIIKPAKQLVSSSQNVNGIIGLSSATDDKDSTNYIDLLYSQNKIPAPVFSLILAGAGKTSSITLGDANTDYVQTNQTYKEYDASSASGDQWGLGVSKFKLGNSTILTSGNAVFSSISNDIVLDSASYETWVAELEKISD